jgi:hypothetical protein
MHLVLRYKHTIAYIALGTMGLIRHYNKTRLLQLDFSTFTSEKTRTLLTWKTTSRFGQAVKCGHSNVGQDVPNGHVPNGSELWGAPVLYFLKSCPTSLHLVNISKIRHTFI